MQPRPRDPRPAGPSSDGSASRGCWPVAPPGIAPDARPRDALHTRLVSRCCQTSLFCPDDSPLPMEQGIVPTIGASSSPAPAGIPSRFEAAADSAIILENDDIGDFQA